MWMLWIALAQAQTCDDVCVAVGAMQQVVNDEMGFAFINEASAQIRRRPSTLQSKLHTVVDALALNGCTITAAVQDHAAGAYLRPTFTGHTQTEPLNGSFVRGAVRGQITNGPTIGDGFGSFRGEKVLARRSDDGFIAGVFIRRSGKRGAFVTIMGVCDGAGDVPHSLTDWWGASLVDYPVAGQVCPPGTEPNQMLCDACPAGTASPSGAACDVCPTGTISAPSATTCMECPTGTYASPDGTSCIQCSPGSANNIVGAAACTTCPVGEVAPDAGSVVCDLCSAGTSSNGEGTACVPCAPGSASPTPGGTCDLCATGTISQSGSLACTSCGVGSYAPVPGSTACTSCAPGFSNNIIEASECMICPVGSIAPNPGSVLCDVCGGTTISAVPGGTTCAQCPQGTSPDATHTLCTPDAPACPAGTEPDGLGLGGCTPCAAGTASPAGGVCIVCIAGTSSSMASATCDLCEPGTFSTGGQEVCTPCAPGSVNATQGQATCAQCGPGLYATGPGDQVCLECPINTFSDLSGTAVCTACPPDQYTNSTASTACLSCPFGTYFDPGMQACVMCLPGQPCPPL